MIEQGKAKYVENPRHERGMGLGWKVEVYLQLVPQETLGRKERRDCRCQLCRRHVHDRVKCE